MKAHGLLRPECMDEDFTPLSAEVQCPPAKRGRKKKAPEEEALPANANGKASKGKSKKDEEKEEEPPKRKRKGKKKDEDEVKEEPSKRKRTSKKEDEVKDEEPSKGKRTNKNKEEGEEEAPATGASGSSGSGPKPAYGSKEYKALQSRKSSAYVKAKNEAKKQGKSLEEQKEAGKAVAWLSFPRLIRAIKAYAKCT